VIHGDGQIPSGGVVVHPHALPVVGLRTTNISVLHSGPQTSQTSQPRSEFIENPAGREFHEFIGNPIVREFHEFIKNLVVRVCQVFVKNPIVRVCHLFAEFLYLSKTEFVPLIITKFLNHRVTEFLRVHYGPGSCCCSS
jgi:hypothetical protein